MQYKGLLRQILLRPSLSIHSFLLNACLNQWPISQRLKCFIFIPPKILIPMRSCHLPSISVAWMYTRDTASNDPPHHPPAPHRQNLKWGRHSSPSLSPKKSMSFLFHKTNIIFPRQASASIPDLPMFHGLSTHPSPTPPHPTGTHRSHYNAALGGLLESHWLYRLTHQPNLPIASIHPLCLVLAEGPSMDRRWSVCQKFLQDLQDPTKHLQRRNLPGSVNHRTTVLLNLPFKIIPFAYVVPI